MDREEAAAVFYGEDLMSIWEEKNDGASRDFHRGDDMQMQGLCRDDEEALLERRIADATTVAGAHMCLHPRHIRQSWRNLQCQFVWNCLEVSP